MPHNMGWSNESILSYCSYTHEVKNITWKWTVVVLKWIQLEINTKNHKQNVSSC